MTCKDCLHCDWCKKVVLAFHFGFDENAENMENNCGGFENRSGIDKQTPKKPLRKVPDYDGCYDFPCYEFFCPACEKRIVAKLGSEWHCGKPQKYCDECGQALDWSDYE